MLNLTLFNTDLYLIPDGAHTFHNASEKFLN